ncbi:hypothetical protein GCM10009616_40650 [Microlunatus lacustris]
MGDRWNLTDTPPEVATEQTVRWLKDIPLRVERLAQGRPALDYENQLRAYREHLAGRDVRSSVGTAVGFMLFTVRGEEPPAALAQWAVAHPPPIDLTSSRAEQATFLDQ